MKFRECARLMCDGLIKTDSCNNYSRRGAQRDTSCGGAKYKMNIW